MNQTKQKKNKKWTKFRHKVVHLILRLPLHLLCKIMYGIKIEKFKEQENRPYLILYNHQTAFDQFFVGLAFKRPVYYLASEDIFSNGALSSLIKYLVEPIPIKKQTTDIKAILNCMRVAKEGGSIAIAPEGNRTYSGETVYMSPAISSLARKMGMPVVLYHIEGGYGVQPRWSDVTRRGGMRAYISRVIMPEEYKDMTDDELFKIIKTDLYINEAKADREFRHKKLAEHLERCIYFCPHCGLASFKSKNDIITCDKCGMTVRYTPTKELRCDDKAFKYRFVLDWYNAQCDYVNSLNLAKYENTAMFNDTAQVREVIPNEKKILVCDKASVTLFGNRIVVTPDVGEPFIFGFEESSAVTVLGKNKLNIYHGGKIYQLKGDKSFCALKFVHIFHRYKNISKGDENDKFLGI